MTTKEKIIETIGEIPDEKLNELLEMVEDFKKRSAAGKNSGKWSHFAGMLSTEQADAMLSVIEETCERIDNE